jgi:acyl-CoA synthetase (AMP-forming)/AMP-acid ligase II
LRASAGVSPVTPAPAPDPAAYAVFVFSSGTTGLPKAVRHTRASFAAAVGDWRAVLGMTSADRIQVATPPSHILGILNIVTALETGAWMRLHRRFDLDTVLACIQDDRITIEMAVAPIAIALAAHPKLESFDLSSLRYIMWGATPVTASVAQTVTRRAGVAWLPAYGASELPVIACTPLAGARLDSVGLAAPGVELRVVALETVAEALECARSIAALPQQAVEATKRLLNLQLEKNVLASLGYANYAEQVSFTTDDFAAIMAKLTANKS